MSRGRQVVLVVSIAVLVAGACLLPYRFPPSGFVVGASSEVGFNNAVAYEWYAALLLVPGFIAAAAFASKLSPRQLVPTDRPTVRLAWGFGVVAALHVLAFAALYVYKGRLFFSEANYFQIVLLRMVAGDRLYLDVQFYYGPSMMYPAYWLTNIMSPQAAYAVWYTANYVAGLAVLLEVLRRLLKSDAMALRWFVLFSIGLVNPWNGLNATFVRYLFPTLVLLWMADAVWRGGTRRIARAIAALAFALTFSFDMAAASLAAAVVFLGAALMEPALRSLAARLWADAPVDTDARDSAPPTPVIVSRGAILLGGALLAALAFYLAVDPSGTALRMYADTAVSYAAGAHNMPVSPTLAFLTMVGVSIVATGLALAHFGKAHDQHARLIMLALLALAVATQRGAFGVTDPVHITFYALPLVLLCLSASTWLVHGRSFRNRVAAAVVLGMALPVQYYHATQLWPIVSKLHRTVATTPASSQPGAPTRAVEETLTDLVRCGGTTRPYVMWNLDYYSQPVYQREKLRYAGYYPMLITTRTHDGIARMISDVRREGAIVIARPDDVAAFQPTPQHTGIMKLVDGLVGAATNGSALGEVNARSAHRLYEPFANFIKSEYRPICAEDGLVAYAPGG